MDPMAFLKFKPMLEQFRERHPKFVSFFGFAGQHIKEDSLLEISVTDPDGKKIVTNIRVSPEDIALFQTFGSMLHTKGGSHDQT